MAVISLCAVVQSLAFLELVSDRLEPGPRSIAVQRHPAGPQRSSHIAFSGEEGRTRKASLSDRRHAAERPRPRRHRAAQHSLPASEPGLGGRQRPVGTAPPRA